jgi:hypothetical protein
MLERFDRTFGSLHERLDAAVFQISYISSDLMPSRRTLRKISEADALDLSTNQKLSCDNNL